MIEEFALHDPDITYPAREGSPQPSLERKADEEGILEEIDQVGLDAVERVGAAEIEEQDCGHALLLTAERCRMKRRPAPCGAGRPRVAGNRLISPKRCRRASA